MNVNYVAFGTVTLLGVTTIISTVAAATTASVVATVAYGILAIVCAGVSIASVTAWIDSQSTTVENYFNQVKEHAGYAIAGMTQFVAQVLVQAVIMGVAEGLRDLVRDKIANGCAGKTETV